MVSRDLNLLLLGKTGNGKSATANTILGFKAFDSTSSTTSVTSNVQSQRATFNDHVIQVVEIPGLADTRSKVDDAMGIVSGNLALALQQSPEGFHAVLLVQRYGTRFTEEDSTSVALLKKALGERFVREFCILVFTCGDIFEMDPEESGKCFKDWCSEQVGELSQLMQDCGGRVVLFDNRDKRKQGTKLNELISLIGELQCIRYTGIDFDDAKNSRERYIVELNMPSIRENTNTEILKINQRIASISTSPLHERLQDLKVLLSTAQSLASSVDQQDKGTGVLSKIKKSVEAVHQRIHADMQAVQRQMEEEERIRLHNAALEIERALQALKLKELEDAAMRAEAARLEEERQARERFAEVQQQAAQAALAASMVYQQRRRSNDDCRIL